MGLRLRRLSSWLVFVLCLCGILIASYLSMRHYAVLSGNVDKPSFCSFSKSFDCDKVSASRYAEILGYPLSSLGLGFYLVFAALSLLVLFLNPRIARMFLAWLIILSLVALCFDLYLGSVLVFRLRVFCLLCVATYLINLMIFILAWRCADKEIRFTSLKEVFSYFSANALKPFSALNDINGGSALMILSGTILFILALLSFSVDRVWKYQNSGGMNNEAEMKTKIREAFQKAEKAKEDMALSESPQIGTDNAKITVVEFSDFECPFCRKAAFSIKPMLARFPDNVRFIFKNYPLDQSCNASITHEMHKSACLYAKAALCVREKEPPARPNDDAYWAMHDFIFQHEERISIDALTDKAKSLGMDPEKFTACLESASTHARLQRDIELGNRLQIRSTPTLFINGRRWEYGVHPKVLEMLFEVALENDPSR